MEIQYLIKLILGSMLFICAIKDVMCKKISFYAVVAASIGIIILLIISRHPALFERVQGMGIGVGLILLSKVTGGQLGMGDGIVFCVTGMGLGFWDNTYLLLYSLICSSVFATLVLVTKKMDRKQVIPFIPFVLVAYIGVLLG